MMQYEGYHNIEVEGQEKERVLFSFLGVKFTVPVDENNKPRWL